MLTIDLLFVGFSVNLILASFFTVTAVNSVIALMGLIFAFLNTFCLFFLMELEFISLLFLIVYVGAISVLFLFSIMLFNLKDVIRSKTISFALKNVISICLLILVIFFIFNYLGQVENITAHYNMIFLEKDPKDIKNIREFMWIMYDYPWWPWIQFMIMPYPIVYRHITFGDYNEISYLGQVLYDRYTIYLILTSLILLISMIGAVTLINNPKEQIQIQHVTKQISKSVKIRNIK
jgi:NADH:ubiquinone oxidoreductase subunit 6 (subunit J)